MARVFANNPFAATGDRTVTPTAQQPDGTVSYAVGFTPRYELDLATDPDALPIERDTTNGLFYDITQAVGEIQAQGAPLFITAADNGGTAFAYTRGARVRGGTPLRTYVSRIDNNTAALTDAGAWSIDIFEAATNQQAIAGVSPDTIVTPAALAAALAASSAVVPDATTTVKGIQRNGTNAEAAAGTLDNVTVTPAGLTAAVATMVPAASTTVAGRIRIGTAQEQTAGVSGAVAVTPAGMKTELDKKLSLSGGNMFGELAIQRNSPSYYYLPPTLSGRGYRTTGSVTDSNDFGWSLDRFQNGGWTAILTVSPAGALSTTGGFDTGSSRTIKHDIRPIAYGLAEVESLQAVSYVYDRDYNDDGRKRLGFIAEDVRALMAEPVTVNPEGYASPLSLQHDQLLPVLWRAVQELSARVRELEGR